MRVYVIYWSPKLQGLDFRTPDFWKLPYTDPLYDVRQSKVCSSIQGQERGTPSHQNRGSPWQVWQVLREGPGDYTMPGWAPYCAATLQIALPLALRVCKTWGACVWVGGPVQSRVHREVVCYYGRLVCCHICHRSTCPGFQDVILQDGGFCCSDV